MGEVGEGTIYDRLVGGGDAQFDRYLDIFLHVYMFAGFSALPCGLRHRQRRRGQKKNNKKYVMEVNT